jgi:hypothetical protein
MAEQTPEKKPVRDSNRKPPEHKLETLPFEPAYSVPNMTVLNGNGKEKGVWKVKFGFNSKFPFSHILNECSIQTIITGQIRDYRKICFL